MTAVALKDLFSRLRKALSTPGIHRNEHSAALDAFLVIRGVVMIEIVITQHPRNRAPGRANRCADASSCGNRRRRNSASRSQGAHARYGQGRDA